MASIKRIDGRLQNEKGEWVWNGESYEFVQSHSDWLPLTFQSQSDSAKFKKLENIYNAEQIIKNSKNPQEVLAAKQWLSRQGVKHDDMNDTMAYTYLYHAKKGEERAGHKYTSREWNGNGWKYFYEKSGLKAKQEYDDSLLDARRKKYDYEYCQNVSDMYEKELMDVDTSAHDDTSYFIYNHIKDKYQEAQAEAIRAKIEYKKAEEIVEEKRIAYSETPLYKIEEKCKKGFDIVDKLINQPLLNMKKNK